MRQTGKPSIKDILADRFSSEWKLLSDTEAFVAHTPEFPSYEAQFKSWRAELHARVLSDTRQAELRKEIVELRKNLRLMGYDLSLGLQRLVVRGFRNDDSMAEGFRRVVICFCGPSLYFQTGTANHVTIAEELLDTLTRRNLLRDVEIHYLWFRRTQSELSISGSATERETDFRRLQDRAEANPLKLLSSLRNLA